jgi:Zn-dependent metalloprotease
VETHSTASGGDAVRLQQTHRGLPVLGGLLVVNLDPSGDVLSILGETSPKPEVASRPDVGEAEAAASALGTVSRAQDVGRESLTVSQPRLRVYDPRLLGAPGPFQQARLAWVLEVTGDADPIRELVVVDAELGTVALHFDQIAAALDREVCDADNTTSQVPCTAPVRTEGDPPVADATFDDVNDAYDFAGDTYGFFAGLGRDSLDDAGMTLVSTVDYCDPSQPCPYENAFWNGSQMVYGDGFAAADDVVGHELTHGVTEFSSHLFYYQQSGAINESMSDVFGEFVDLTNLPADPVADRWLLGEDLPGIGAIRDMENPPAFGDPDRMTSPNYTADPNEQDAGGVHSNSGVNNKATFLITDGATFNGQTVTGIGIPKASRIYYEVNNSMLTSASDYSDLANALRQGCTNLIGTGGITAADCTEVGEAVMATEMDTDPPAAPATDLPPANTTCAGGTTFTNLFFDDLENPGSGNWAPSAAVGMNRWFYPQNPNPIGLDPTFATSGDTNFWGYDQPAVADYSIATTDSVALPENAFLRFEHAYGFEDTPGPGATTPFDGGVVEYSTDNGGSWQDVGSRFDFNGYAGTIANTGFGNPLEGRQAFVRESNGYISSRASLADLSGESVRFRFRIGTDGSTDDYGWFVDDVRIYACAPPPPPPPGEPPPQPPGPDGDVVDPQTSIDDGPKSKTTKRNVKFEFSSNEPGSSFDCRLKGKRAKQGVKQYKPCTSPKKYKRLKPGKYKFQVRAIDAAGNVDPSAAKQRFTVEDKRKR